MTIYLLDREKFNENDDYETMMDYAIVLFGASVMDLERVKNDSLINATKIVLTEDYFINRIN